MQVFPLTHAISFNSSSVLPTSPFCAPSINLCCSSSFAVSCSVSRFYGCSFFVDSFNSSHFMLCQSIHSVLVSLLSHAAIVDSLGVSLASRFYPQPIDL